MKKKESERREAERTEEIDRYREMYFKAGRDAERDRLLRQARDEEISELKQKLEEAYSKMAKISADAAFVASKALDIAKIELSSIPTAEIEEGCLCETEGETE